MRKKISIIGAGNVGRETASWCAIKELGDIVIWNRTKEKAVGVALDLMEAGSVAGYDVDIVGTGNLSKTKGSDIIVFTSGFPRKPGMKREELVGKNAGIVRPLIKELAKLSPNAIILMLTNPLDVMAYVAFKASGFSRKKVIGMAGILDSSRFESFIAKDLGVSVKDVSALVLGSHGENMVPLPRLASVGGVRLSEMMSERRVRVLVEHTKKAGAEIVELLNANASFSVGAAASRLVESISKDKREVLPCSVYLSGEYGLKGLFIGVPCIIGEKGLERIVRLKLNAGEKKLLADAGKRIKKMIKEIF